MHTTNNYFPILYHVINYLVDLDPRVKCPDEDTRCSLDATCQAVSFSPPSYKCICNEGYIGDGAKCAGIVLN